MQRGLTLARREAGCAVLGDSIVTRSVETLPGSADAERGMPFCVNGAQDKVPSAKK